MEKRKITQRQEVNKDMVENIHKYKDSVGTRECSSLVLIYLLYNTVMFIV